MWRIRPQNQSSGWHYLYQTYTLTFMKSFVYYNRCWDKSRISLALYIAYNAFLDTVTVAALSIFYNSLYNGGANRRITNAMTIFISVCTASGRLTYNLKLWFVTKRNKLNCLLYFWALFRHEWLHGTKYRGVMGVNMKVPQSGFELVMVWTRWYMTHRISTHTTIFILGGGGPLCVCHCAILFYNVSVSVLVLLVYVCVLSAIKKYNNIY